MVRIGRLFRFEQALPGRDNTTLNLLGSGHYHMLVSIRMDQGHHTPWVICTVSVAIHGDGVAFTYNLSMTFKVACVQGCELQGRPLTRLGWPITDPGAEIPSRGPCSPPALGENPGP